MDDDQAMHRIAVIGAGAIGSALGALLHRAGYDVDLIARPDHVTAIRQGGLQVDGIMGKFIASVEAFENLNFRPDLALLTVKAQDVVKAVTVNKAFLQGIPLVTLQNGIHSHEDVANILPREWILSAVVTMNASYLEPGKVTVASVGNLIIGHPFVASIGELEEVAQILNHAIPTCVSENIEGAHWLKLIVNLNNALPAITNYSMNQVYADKYLSNLAVQIVREGQRTILRAGIKLDSLPEISVAAAKLLYLIPERIAGHMIAKKFRRVTTEWPLRSSTLQSILRRRPVEIDYLNGEIVELGKRCGEMTPLNAKIVELVHKVESTGQFLTVEQVRQAFSQ